MRVPASVRKSVRWDHPLALRCWNCSPWIPRINSGLSVMGIVGDGSGEVAEFWNDSETTCNVLPRIVCAQNSSFALPGPELQLAIAQTMENQANELNSKLSSSMDNSVLFARLQLLPLALLFCVDAMKNVIRQISRMTLQLRDLSIPAFWRWVPLCKIPWRIHWDSYREKGVPTPLCTITPPFLIFHLYLACTIHYSFQVSPTAGPSFCGRSFTSKPTGPAHKPSESQWRSSEICSSLEQRHLRPFNSLCLFEVDTEFILLYCALFFLLPIPTCLKKKKSRQFLYIFFEPLQSQGEAISFKKKSKSCSEPHVCIGTYVTSWPKNICLIKPVAMFCMGKA